MDQLIVGIDVVHRFRRDELVLDEHGRGDGPAMEDVERDGDDLGAVFPGSTRPIR